MKNKESIKNRNLAFQEVKKTLSKRQKQVYNVISLLQPCTLDEVCVYLNAQKNRVSGRISELKALLLINENGSKKNMNGYTATLYKIVTENERKKIIESEIKRLENDIQCLTIDLTHVKFQITGDLIEQEVKNRKKLLRNLKNLSL